MELIADSAGARLGACYQQVPLRILAPFRFGPGQPSLVYLLNPTAGLLDGDAHLVQMEVHPGCRAVVVGQSASRIHPSLRAFSTQQWHVRVGAGATLVVLPGPAIPFQGCRFYQRVTIELAETAGLVWGDIWLAGRYARGAKSEQFQFRMILQEMTVRRAGRLVFRDRSCWRGPWDRSAATWHFGATAAASSIFVTARVEEGQLPGGYPCRWSCFPTAAQDTCLRCQGPAEAVTSATVHSAFLLASVLSGDPDNHGWLFPTYDLAPIHWFSLPRSL